MLHFDVDHDAALSISGRDFPPDSQSIWDGAGALHFFFLHGAGPLSQGQLRTQSYAYAMPMAGVLRVNLLDERLRGGSFTLCMDLTQGAINPPIACSGPIIFADEAK